MEFPDIIYAKSDAIASIKLDRADTRNAFTDAMVKSLSKAFHDARSDPRIKVIVLSG
ncbi:MAG: hypothetical protein JRI80_11925 [Deltaproteobacteria bacterium]|nr:hypothetical protein [Deltaproteobacteria bacterium]